MNVLMINDSSSNPNWGDRAAAIALKEMTRRTGARLSGLLTEDELRHTTFYRSPAAQSNGESATYARVANLLLPPIVPKLGRRVLRLVDRGRSESVIPEQWDQYETRAQAVLRNADAWGELLALIEQADVTLIHGDGCMVGNGILPRTELFLTYLIKKHFGKPVVLVNHTADFDHPDLRAAAEQVYPLLDNVVFRDPQSVERCKSFCNGRYAADSAFYFEPLAGSAWKTAAARLTFFDVFPDEARFDPTRPYICMGGSSIFSYDGTPVELIDAYTALVEHIAERYTGQIVLTVSDIVDQPVMRPIARRLGIPLIGLHTPVQQAVDVLGHADAYVGGRWHPSIFAMRGGTPVIPISSKTFKMASLMQAAGLGTKTFDALNLRADTEAIGVELSRRLEQGESLRTQLRDWAASASHNSWDNVSYIARRLQ